MIVVSDTSPLNYLILLGHARLLEELYGRVMIPQAVWTELQAAAAPAPVQEWVANRPGWVEVQEVPDPDPTLRLDPGEQEAITLAERIKADVVLLDERAVVRRQKSVDWQSSARLEFSKRLPSRN